MNTVVRSVSTAAMLLLLSCGSVIADTPDTPDTPNTALSPGSGGTPVPDTAAPRTDRLRTEAVFCIDCSGSMGQSLARAQAAMAYLIDEMQAKTPDVPIRVGIIRYGTGMDPLEVCPLTDDPKTISGYLSRLRINGGAEFVGTFIKNAVEHMQWSGEGNVVRQVIMVGNETAFQGPVDYRLAAKAAFNRGFSVSAMYCPTIMDERGADSARATATTRIVGAGRPSFGSRLATLDVENSWILTAYFGGGEVMKLSADPRNPLMRYSRSDVVRLVEDIIPQQEARMAQADAAFAAYDARARMGRGNLGAGTPARMTPGVRRR